MNFSHVHLLLNHFPIIGTIVFFALRQAFLCAVNALAAFPGLTAAALSDPC